MTMPDEPSDELTTEHAAAIVTLIDGYMRDAGVRFGYTLLTFDRDGIKTMGNMPDEAQCEMFAFVAARLGKEGPDSFELVELTKPPTH